MTVVDEVVVDRGPADGPEPADEVTGPEHTGRRRRVRGWRSLVAGGLGYLALSVGLWWQVWSTHPTAVTTCGCGDTSLFTWFLAWPAFAIRHGLDPLYSTYLFHPTGVNLLSNTAEVGFGILLAPVTWAFGPDRHPQRRPHPEPGPVGAGHVRAPASLGDAGPRPPSPADSSTGSRPSWWSASPTPT